LIYLDSNFFLFSLFDQSSKGENARKLAREITKGEKKALTSALTLDEVMWIVIKNKRREALRSNVENIYAMQNLSIKEVSVLPPLFRGRGFLR
jgi:predicted nucleic acid-binding protein